MGRMKEYLYDMEEQSSDRRLAKVLGITYDELLQLGHDLDTEESDDGLVYNYIISFDDDAPEEILKKVRGIDGNNQVWLAPGELDEEDYYFDEQYEAIVSNKHYYDSFINALSASEQLNKIEVNEGLAQVLKRQTYVSVIAALEAFLSETFINLIDENPDYFRRFIETFPDFKETKFELSQIFIQQENLKNTVKKVLLGIMYHNLAKIGKMYASTFQIEFPEIGELAKCVSIRHDLVHRNGKTKNGEIIDITSEAVANLIEKGKAFANSIAQKLGLVAELPDFDLE